MKVHESSALRTLRRIQGFLDTHAEFAGVNQSSPRRALDEVVTQFSTSATDQVGGLRDSEGETARQHALLLTLRLHYMQPIAAAARARLREVPEFAALTMPDSHASVERVVAAAHAMAEAAKQYESVLVGAGLPANFIDGLVAVTKEVEQSVETRSGSRKQHVDATLTLAGQERRARSIIRILSAAILPVVGNDEVLFAEWKVVKRIERKPQSVSGSTTDASASGVTQAPATATPQPGEAPPQAA